MFCASKSIDCLINLLTAGLEWSADPAGTTDWAAEPAGTTWGAEPTADTTWG